MVFKIFFKLRSNHNHGGTNHATMQQIAFLKDIDDGVFLMLHDDSHNIPLGENERSILISK